MNPIVLAGAFGFLKGILGGSPSRSRSLSSYVAAGLGASLIEETVYRALPNALFGGLPMGFTAAKFAADHIAPGELPRGQSPVSRFVDVFAGGLLYESAFERGGLLGAVAAHCLHNVAVGLAEGSPVHTVRRRKRRGAPKRRGRKTWRR